jgi:hypothetical protein
MISPVGLAPRRTTPRYGIAAEAANGWSGASRSTHPPSSMRGCEEVRVDVALDLAAEVCCLHVRIPEVDPRPDTGFEHLVRQIGEAIERALLSAGANRTQRSDQQIVRISDDARFILGFG